MDRKWLLKRFVIENSSILLSASYNKNAIRNIKRKYFIDRYSNKIGVPKNKEIAEALVEGFIAIRKIINIEELTTFVHEYPFLRKHIYDINKFEHIFTEVKPPVTIDDIKKLKTQSSYELERGKIKKEVIAEATEEIQEAIEKKTEEYLSVPSILDQEEIEEPSVTSIPKFQSQKEWWERLNLMANPFPRQEGLSQIPTDMYEAVVVKTQIYKTYTNRAQQNIEDLLYKGKLLIGDTGYGKTTLFDYLSYVLIENKLKIFRITLQPRGDVVTYNVQFENELYNEVKSFYKERFKYDYAGDPSINTIIEMLNILNNNENWCFILVLDDLHKIIGGEGVVLKFLGSLQISKDKMIRKGAKIGFLVAGLPDWQNYFRTDGAFRGFFDTPPDFMPEVTPEIAYEVIKKRILAYAKNTEINNFVDLDFIKQIHRKTINEGRYLGFRTFMSNVEIELRKGNFSIFESNPIEVEPDKLNIIQEIIEKESVLKASFNKYIYGSKIQTEENRDFGLKVLIKIFLEKGINESDEFFLSHDYYFQKLARSNLINKVKIEQDKIKWIVNPLLVKVNDEILSRYNLSLEDYLRPLYIKPFKKKELLPVKHERDLFDVFIDENTSALSDYIELLRASVSPYRKAISLNLIKIKEEDVIQLVENWKISLAQISSCVFNFENLLPVKSLSPSEILTRWSDYWTYPDALKRFIDELASFNNRRDQIPLLRRFFIEAFNEIFNLFKNDFVINKQIYFPLESLKQDEIHLLYSCRNLYSQPYKMSNYFDLLKLMNNHIEKKIRIFLRNFMNLLYGDSKNMLKQIKDDSIRKYIETDPRIYEGISFNEFENLNRGQYKKLFMECPNLKKAIFEHVLGSTYKNDFKAFFEAFCDYNIITAHLKMDSLQPQDQSRIHDYIIHSTEFIKKINNAYLNIFDQYFYIGDETSTEIKIYFSLRGIKAKEISKEEFKLEGKILKDITDIKPVRINQSEIDRVVTILRNIKNGDIYHLDLENYFLIERLFTIEYRCFISVLAYLKWNGRISIDNKFGTWITIRL